MKNAMQLKAIMKKLAKENQISAQLVLQNYMLERFLERVSISPYRDNYIIKGGFLISSMVGLNSRATMDMDATIKGYPPQKGGRRSRRGKRRRPPERPPQPFLFCFFLPCSAHLSLFVIFLLRRQRQKPQRLFVFVLMGKGNIQLFFPTDADALYHVNERPAV